MDAYLLLECQSSLSSVKRQLRCVSLFADFCLIAILLAESDSANRSIAVQARYVAKTVSFFTQSLLISCQSGVSEQRQILPVSLSEQNTPQGAKLNRTAYLSKMGRDKSEVAIATHKSFPYNFM